MRQEYKNFIKEAKSLKISTLDELENLLYRGHDSITGGELECAKKILKIK